MLLNIITILLNVVVDMLEVALHITISFIIIQGTHYDIGISTILDISCPIASLSTTGQKFMITLKLDSN